MNKKPNNHKRTALVNLIGIAVAFALLSACTTPTTLQLVGAMQDIDNLEWTLDQLNMENVRLKKEIAQLKEEKENYWETLTDYDWYRVFQTLTDKELDHVYLGMINVMQAVAKKDMGLEPFLQFSPEFKKHAKLNANHLLEEEYDRRKALKKAEEESQ